MYIATGQGKQPQGQNVDVNRILLSLLSLRSFATSLKKISLNSDFIHLFIDNFIHVYSPGEGTVSPRGQNFDVNKNVLSLHSFVASFKKNVFEVWFLYIFFMI